MPFWINELILNWWINVCINAAPFVCSQVKRNEFSIILTKTVKRVNKKKNFPLTNFNPKQINMKY